MQPTAGPTTRRGGLTAGSGENDAGNKDAGKNDAGNNDAGKNDAGKNDAGNNDAGKNDAGNNDALPTDAGKNDHHLDSTQAAVLLSTVRAASEEEKSPFEASMLQQYQKVRGLFDRTSIPRARSVGRCPGHVIRRMTIIIITRDHPQSMNTPTKFIKNPSNKHAGDDDADTCTDGDGWLVAKPAAGTRQPAAFQRPQNAIRHVERLLP